MEKEKLSENVHWRDIHKKNDNLINTISNLKVLESYYHFVFLKIVKKFRSDRYKNFIEIGCAPGNYLIKFKKNFGLDVYGVEYEDGGYKKTIQNVSHYGIQEENIILADFFDENFLYNNKNKYDIVFSAGFIEHFQNPKGIINKQVSLLKENGMLICIIPNVKYLNEFFSDKKTIALHNQSIMDLQRFKDLFTTQNLNVQYCDYFGGIFNFGLFGQKKSIANIIFKMLFVIQRIVLDNLEKIYFIITKQDPVCRYSSPSLICIARKKQ